MHRHGAGPGKDLLGSPREQWHLADVGGFILCQHSARYYLDTEMNFSLSVLLKVNAEQAVSRRPPDVDHAAGAEPGVRRELWGAEKGRLHLETG